MTTLTTKPVLPVPGRESSITFTASAPTATFIRVWIVDAPDDSVQKAELERTGQSQVLFHEGDRVSSKAFTPTKGGTYLFKIIEYVAASVTYGGGYQGDPSSSASLDQVGAEYERSVQVGQRMVSQVGAGGDTAELVFYVWNDTIRPTLLDVHGEVTPAIVSPSSVRARTAIRSSEVVDALAVLQDLAVATAIGSLSTVLANIVSEFTSHLTQSGVHDTDDTDNAPDAGFANATTPENLAGAVSKLITDMRRHMLNDAGSGPGTSDPAATGSHVPYHSNSNNRFDWTNLPLFISVGGTAEAYRALADLWRAYEGHRTANVHDSGDATNTLTALPPLLELHRTIFAELAAMSPSVPQTQTTGAVLLITQTGAVEQEFN